MGCIAVSFAHLAAKGHILNIQSKDLAGFRAKFGWAYPLKPMVCHTPCPEGAMRMVRLLRIEPGIE
jgi:hypothetical protein